MLYDVCACGWRGLAPDQGSAGSGLTLGWASSFSVIGSPSPPCVPGTSRVRIHWTDPPPPFSSVGARQGLVRW